MPDTAIVGTVIALAGTVVTSVATIGTYVARARSKEKLEAIKQGGDAAARLVADAVTSFAIDVKQIPAHALPQIVIEEIRSRDARHQRLFRFLALMVVVLAVVTVALGLKGTVSGGGSAHVESIPFDRDQVVAGYSNQTCIVSNTGLIPYCVDKTIEQCGSDIAASGGAFAAHHRCIKRPSVVFCGAYRSKGQVRVICYTSQDQCDAGRPGYLRVPDVQAVSDSCQRV